MPMRPKAECCWRFKLISGQRFSHLLSLFSLADISDPGRGKLQPSPRYHSTSAQRGLSLEAVG